MFWADCYPRGGVLFLSILQPFVVPAVDRHRFVVGEHLPLCGTLCPRVATSIVEPPKALVLELSRLIDLHWSFLIRETIDLFFQIIDLCQDAISLVLRDGSHPLVEEVHTAMEPACWCEWRPQPVKLLELTVEGYERGKGRTKYPSPIPFYSSTVRHVFWVFILFIGNLYHDVIHIRIVSCLDE